MAPPIQPREARLFGYARASKAKQSASPGTQKEMCQKYAEFNNLPPFTAWYVDPDKSGKHPLADRDAGRELLNKLKPGDHVIVYMLDRMFRNLRDCLVVLEEFKNKNIKLHVTNIMGGALDLSSPIGEFLIQILGAVSQLERAFISQRTKDGLAARKAQNKAHTRFPGYGRKWAMVPGPTGRLQKTSVRDDDEREVMKSLVIWRLQNGSTWEDMAKHLKTLGKLTKEGTPWSQNRIRRAFQAELALQVLEQKK